MKELVSLRKTRFHPKIALGGRNSDFCGFCLGQNYKTTKINSKPV